MQPISDLYARKSNQDAGRSAARQEREWQRDCAAQGITPGRVFVDPDLSASRHARKPRPDYANLIAHIRSGACQMVSLLEASRGTRRLGEWVSFLDLCRDMSVLVRVISDGGRTYDPRNQYDREALVNQGLRAEGEVETLRSRVMSGNTDAAYEGRPPGPLLYGYARIYGAPDADSRARSGQKRRTIKQVINDEEAAVVLRLVADTIAGVPLAAQAKRLNEAGVPTPKGRGAWTGGGVGRLLRHPGYRGHRVHNGEIVCRDAWPAIITDDLAAQLDAVFASDRSGRHGPSDGTLAHQLSGAALCGACRRPLRAKWYKGSLRYECIRQGCGAVAAIAGPMDKLVSDMIVERLRQPDAAAAFEPAPDDAAIGAARRQLAALRARLDEVHAQAGQPDGPSVAMLTAAERALKPQIDAAEAEVRRLSAPPELQGIDPEVLAGRWDDTAPALRREVTLALAEVVLSPVGRAGRWSMWRLAESRWRGDEKTWGDAWRSAG